VSTVDSLTCFMLVSGKSDSEATYLCRFERAALAAA
jgi:hypothetical protein